MTMLHHGVMLPVLQSSARFLRPVFYDDVLDFRAAVVDIRHRGFRLEHRVFKGRDVVADGFEVRICARIKGAPDGRIEALPIPADLNAALESRLTRPTPPSA